MEKSYKWQVPIQDNSVVFIKKKQAKW